MFNVYNNFKKNVEVDFSKPLNSGNIIWQEKLNRFYQITFTDSKLLIQKRSKIIEFYLNDIDKIEIIIIKKNLYYYPSLGFLYRGAYNAKLQFRLRVFEKGKIYEYNVTTKFNTRRKGRENFVFAMKETMRRREIVENRILDLEKKLPQLITIIDDSLSLEIYDDYKHFIWMTGIFLCGELVLSILLGELVCFVMAIIGLLLLSTLMLSFITDSDKKGKLALLYFYIYFASPQIAWCIYLLFELFGLVPHTSALDAS